MVRPLSSSMHPRSGSLAARAGGTPHSDLTMSPRRRKVKAPAILGRSRGGTPAHPTPLGRAELEARLPHLDRAGKAEALHRMRSDALRAHRGGN